jgi:hypothetical protein
VKESAIRWVKKPIAKNRAAGGLKERRDEKSANAQRLWSRVLCNPLLKMNFQNFCTNRILESNQSKSGKNAPKEENKAELSLISKKECKIEKIRNEKVRWLNFCIF